jgi:hypothetical protein
MPPGDRRRRGRDRIDHRPLGNQRLPGDVGRRACDNVREYGRDAEHGGASDLGSDDAADLMNSVVEDADGSADRRWVNVEVPS